MTCFKIKAEVISFDLGSASQHGRKIAIKSLKDIFYLKFKVKNMIVKNVDYSRDYDVMGEAEVFRNQIHTF